MSSSTAAELERLVVAEEARQFVLQLDDEIVGWALFSVRDGVMTISHVETAPQHRGKDFAARLMHGVLDAARTQALQVRPMCGYAAAFMRQRPTTHDLLASA